MAELRINVNKVGNVKMDAEGFEGESCTIASKSFEDALAGVTTNRETKPEFYDTPASSGVEAENMRM